MGINRPPASRIEKAASFGISWPASKVIAASVSRWSAAIGAGPATHSSCPDACSAIDAKVVSRVSLANARSKLSTTSDVASAGT
jgi:hypothetical protein